jgi:hypothetical protein
MEGLLYVKKIEKRYPGKDHPEIWHQSDMVITYGYQEPGGIQDVIFPISDLSFIPQTQKKIQGYAHLDMAICRDRTQVRFKRRKISLGMPSGSATRENCG